MIPNPLVSIVITSYNTGHFIEKAITSALAQDYENIEIIISDNNSSDNSDEVIKKFCSNSKIKYSKNDTNIGMIANFNKAFFELSKGDFITNISSDDYFIDETFISSAIKKIKENDNVLLVFGKYQSFFTKSDTIVDMPCQCYYQTSFRKGIDVFLDFAECPYFGWGGCIMNRNFLVKNKMLIPDIITNDIYMNLELMLHGNVAFIDSNVYMIRYHGNNATGSVRTANQYISSRLNYINDLYKKALQNNEIDKNCLEKWKYSMLKIDIKSFLITFILSGNQKEYDIFKNHVKERYENIYNEIIIKDKKYRFTKKVIVPICKINFLRKLATIVFPAKIFFSNPYNKTFTF